MMELDYLELFGINPLDGFTEDQYQTAEMLENDIWYNEHYDEY